MASLLTSINRVPYEEQIAKKHKLGFRYLNTLRKKLNVLPEISEAGRAQIAWTNSM
jgi:tRNA (uracil-5-)-methyltransferase